MVTYYSGGQYGFSDILDVSGKPLLTYTDPATGKKILCADRVAVVKDPTKLQTWTVDELYNARLDVETSSALKQAVGGTSKDNLDHRIPLEMGGSNQLANLALEAIDPSTGAQPSNPFENGTTADVMAGKISLATGWRRMSAGKGFALAEDIRLTSGSGFTAAAQGLLDSTKKLIATKDFGSFDKTLKAQIDQDGGKLNGNPLDLRLREQIFREQVTMTAKQLGITETQAQGYVKAFTAKYADAKNGNAQEVLGALTANEQKLIGVSAENPNVLGVDNTIWANVAAALAVGSAAVAVVGVIALIITVMTGGTADAVAAIGAGSVAGILALIEISIPAAVAITSFAIAAFLEGLAFIIPMITKQMLDAKTIAPSLIATSLNDDIKNIKALRASIGGSSSSSSQSSASSGQSSNTGSIKVFSGIVSSGNLSNGVSFTARPDDLITNMTDLNNAAQNNLAPFLTAIGSKLAYEIKIVSSVVNSDGTTSHGATRQIVSGYNKNGTPKYKTVTNRFAELIIYALTQTNTRTKLQTIVLGPTDAALFNPSLAQTDAVALSVGSTIHTNDISTIKTVAAPAAIPAAAPRPVVVTQPTPAPAAASAQKYIGTTNQGVQYEGTGSTPQTFIADKEANNQASGVELLTLQAARKGINASFLIVSVVPKGGSAAVQNSPGTNATTLSEFYSALGQSIPPISARAQLYQDFGLGQAAYYTATAEQNTKLLQALKNAQAIS